MTLLSATATVRLVNTDSVAVFAPSLLSPSTTTVLLFSTGAVAMLVTAFLVLTALRAARRGDKSLTLGVLCVGAGLIAALVGATSTALSLGTSFHLDIDTLRSSTARLLTDFNFILATVASALAAIGAAWTAFRTARNVRNDRKSRRVAGTKKGHHEVNS